MFPGYKYGNRNLTIEEISLFMTNKNIAIRVSNPDRKYTLGGPQEKYLTLRDFEKSIQ